MPLPIITGMEQRMNRDDLSSGSGGDRLVNDALTEVKIFLPDDLARAWQRCSWLLVHDTGRERTDIMAEMVKDFLVKHGC